MRIFLVVSCLLSRFLIILIMFCGIPLIAGLVVSLAGCGEKIESASYYYSPSWTQGGSIIFIKGLQSVRKDAIGTQLGSSYTETVSTMDATGAGESSLFDATGAPPHSMSCSSTRNYAAYLGDLRNEQFGKIIIRSLSFEAFTGMREWTLTFDPRIRSFDWSSDGNKIVYCTSDEVWVRGWTDYLGPGSLVTREANLNFVSWKYGSRIAVVSTSEGTFLVNEDGSGRKYVVAAGVVVDKPQISSANTNEVYGIAGGSYCKVDVSASSPATTEVLANFKGELPRLSSDARKVVYSKAGEQSGIYIIDLTASPIAETEIK